MHDLKINSTVKVYCYNLGDIFICLAHMNSWCSSQ